MLKVTLKDSSVIEVEKGTSILEVAKKISEGLARNATCGKVNGEVKELRYELEEDAEVEILTFDNSEDGKKAYWHTCSHVMAQAIKRLYGDDIEPEISENYNINKNTFYEISFEVEKFKQLLLDVGVIDFSDGLSFNFDIDKNLLLEDETRRAFIKGVYIGSSTSSIKLSSDTTQSCGSGYHMEFVSRSHNFLLEFSSILAEYNIIGKIFERKRIFNGIFTNQKQLQ